ncbi:MAG: hypothetical protein WCE80_13690 [Acidimicrobiia bacterium]
MRTDEDQVIRATLGRMADEAPDPLEYEALGAIRARPLPADQSTKLIFGAVAVVALVALTVFLGNISSTDPAATPAEPSVLLIPGWVPDGLHLVEGEIFDANGDATTNLADAEGTQLEYLVAGASTWVGGDQVVIVGTNDVLAANAASNSDQAGSECWGEAAVESGELDPAVCTQVITDAKKQVHGADALLSSSAVAVRGKPAFVALLEVPTGEELVEESVQVYVFEGGGVISSVVVYGYDQETALKVAESLESVSPQDYTMRTS